MNKDFSDSGFQLEAFPMPCCKAVFNLDELRYEGPQAFGKFGLELKNPNVGLITPEQLAAMESALETRLRIVYMHL